MKQDESSGLLTDRDREILVFAAPHRLVLTTHIQALLGVTEPVCRRLLAGLKAAGLLNQDRAFHHQPGSYRITLPGLAAIRSDLPAPAIDLHSCRKDIGLAWIWLATTRGVGVEREMTRRELRAYDRDGDSASR